MNYYNFKQLEALGNIIYSTDEFFYRQVIRWYSTTFYTPLHIVETLDWDEVLTHYYEYNYSKIPKNEVISLITDLIPELSQDKDKEDVEFIKELLKKEQSLKGNNKNQTPKVEATPKKDSNPAPIINRVFEDEPPEDL
jgi:hypothetical protein